ncbi:hypothetical protein [Bacillus sp. FJAT-29937]|uniref:hypothetical protein n=1 Tax=Bacillus sp. FJAT-29937 TaxID=1720553 RepID=UPI0012E3A7FD|nr:hypothetical protein [Bacillus sp. FJAT-29937]
MGDFEDFVSSSYTLVCLRFEDGWYVGERILEHAENSVFFSVNGNYFGRVGKWVAKGL